MRASVSTFSRWLARRPAVLAASLFVASLSVAGIALRDLAEPSIRGDGVGYYAPLASWLVDRDLDLHNETAHLNRRYLTAAFMTPEGKLGNPFPVGPAHLWAPLVYVVSLLPPNARLDAPIPERARTAHPAFAPRYARALLWTNQVLAVGAGAVLCAALAASVGVWISVLAMLACVLGTPVFYYVLQEPSYGHAASFFAVSVWLTLVLVDRRRRLPLEVLGFTFGVVVLMRSQDVVLGVLLAPRLIDAWKRRVPLAPWARGVPLVRLAWPALLAFTPQMLFWKRIYGIPLLVPPGPDFLPAWKPHVLHLLFSTWNGAAVWTPVLLLGFVGVATMREPRLRLAFVVALALEIYSSAVIADWWGGRAFGPRRLVSIVPLLACGMAYALAAWRSHPRRLLAAVAFMAVACVWTLRLAEYQRRGLLPRNPGNAADYVRHHVPGSRDALRYGHWDYPRLLRDAVASERLLRAENRRRGAAR